MGYRGGEMVSITSQVRSWHTTMQAFKQQPYVYSYRMNMRLLRSRVIRGLVKRYSHHLLTRSQRIADTIQPQSIRDIVTHPAVSRYHFTQLYALCRYVQPRVVVETGVGLGTSSLFILQALEDNGRGTLYSIDEPYAEYQSDAGIVIDESAYCAHNDQPGMLVPKELQYRWRLLLGRSHVLLPTLCNQLGHLDLFFHDSEHTYHNMYQEYTIVWPHLRAQGILASHDVEWNTAFQDFAEAVFQHPMISRNLGLIITS